MSKKRYRKVITIEKIEGLNLEALANKIFKVTKEHRGWNIEATMVVPNKGIIIVLFHN